MEVSHDQSASLRSYDDLIVYQKLMDKSKTEQLPDYEEMQIIKFRFRGISKLPDEKRKRAETLYNKAAILGTRIP
jgi:hypothetical protein